MRSPRPFLSSPNSSPVASVCSFCLLANNHPTPPLPPRSLGAEPRALGTQITASRSERSAVGKTSHGGTQAVLTGTAGSQLRFSLYNFGEI